MAGGVWYYREGEQALGPVGDAELAGLVRRGLIAAGTFVRDGADGAWAAAGQALPHLFAQPSATKGSKWTDTSPHPWRRYFARSLDNALIGGITWSLLGIVFYSVAPEQAAAFFGLFERPGGQFVDAFLSLMVAIPGNAAMVGMTGLSVGKWIFGVRVLRQGAPMGFFRAFRRELSVWVLGLGLGVPVISLFASIGALTRLEERGVTPWDFAQELEVTHRPESLGAGVMMWLAGAVLIGLQIAFRVAASR